MTNSSPTEQRVAAVASVYFGTVDLPIKRGVEIDDACECGDASQCVLSGRLGTWLQRRNPGLRYDTFEDVTRTLSHPPSDPSAEHRTS